MDRRAPVGHYPDCGHKDQRAQDPVFWSYGIVSTEDIQNAMEKVNIGFDCSLIEVAPNGASK